MGRAGSNNSARDNHSHDDSPDGDDTGSPVFRNGTGSKRGGIKTKRNARQQDQNKQVSNLASPPVGARLTRTAFSWQSQTCIGCPSGSLHCHLKQ